jgi:2-iminobutanoate/2-iminopropanoate deaminase
VNFRITILFVTLITAGVLVSQGAFSQTSTPPARRVLNLPDKNPQLPFSDAVQNGNTLYLSGAIGLDKNGKAPADIDEEIRLLLDHIKAALAQANMTMDDLVCVQIFCTDLTFYDKFNSAYRSAFSTKDLPARAFVGVASILRGGHFELQAIAVRR